MFHKLKMESCPIEIPDSKVKHQDGMLYLKLWGTSFLTVAIFKGCKNIPQLDGLPFFLLTRGQIAIQ